MPNKSVSFIICPTDKTTATGHNRVENIERSTLRANSEQAVGTTTAGAMTHTQVMQRTNSKTTAPSNNGNPYRQIEESTFKKIIDSAIQPLHREIHSLLQVVEKLQSEIYVLKGEALSKTRDILPSKVNNENIVVNTSSRPITYENPLTSSSVDSVVLQANPSSKTTKKIAKKTYTYTMSSNMTSEPTAKKKSASKNETTSYWKLAKGLKNKKKPDVTASVDSKKRIADHNASARHILASGFQKNVTIPCIFKFLKKINELGSYEVDELKSNLYGTRAFSIGVPEELVTTFMDPEIWPKGVKVTEWFPAVSSIRETRRRAGSPTKVTMMALSSPKPRMRRSHLSKH